MKLAIVIWLSAAVTAIHKNFTPVQYGVVDDGWSEWSSWSSCSATCGLSIGHDGQKIPLASRSRTRTCPGDYCQGWSIEGEVCNAFECPKWSDWSSWDECSAKCDGGTQSRTRQCNHGEVGELGCRGSTTDEQRCNQRSCNPGQFYYWNFTWPGYDEENYETDPNNRWKHIFDEFLPDGETFLERCIAYCHSVISCIGVSVQTIYYKKSNPRPERNTCYINDNAITEPGYYYYRESGIYDYPQIIAYNVMAVVEEVVKANPSIFPDPDGSIGGGIAVDDGVCDEAESDFGMVQYRNTGAVQFTSWDDKNIITDPDPENCAAKCFATAGCSSFHVDDNGCSFVIGVSSNEPNDQVTESGQLQNICSTSAFTSSFTKRSQFYGKVWAPEDGEEIINNIIATNVDKIGNPLHVWNFEIEGQNPMIASSQYVTLTPPDLSYDGKVYRRITFTFDTYVRVGETQQDNRKRRSENRDSEWIMVGHMTEENIQKAQKLADRKEKQASKQRSLMPRTENILAQIDAIERRATSYILDGAMNLPDGVEVVETGPIETIEFVQTAVDGSVAADCSSGTCECSIGFIDNGNGCEAMTEEQAATTEAPTMPAPTEEPTTTELGTTSATTTELATTASEGPLSIITRLVSVKLQSVFQADRPEEDNPRPHLMQKWMKYSQQFIDRYLDMRENKLCVFDDLPEDAIETDAIDFDEIDTCQDIRSVMIGFETWGTQFTFDCTKEKSNTFNKWYNRKIRKVQKVYRKTLNRLPGC